MIEALVTHDIINKGEAQANQIKADQANKLLLKQQEQAARDLERTRQEELEMLAELKAKYESSNS